jgi:hypothetical protein
MASQHAAVIVQSSMYNGEMTERGAAFASMSFQHID